MNTYEDERNKAAEDHLKIGADNFQDESRRTLSGSFKHGADWHREWENKRQFFEALDKRDSEFQGCVDELEQEKQRSQILVEALEHTLKFCNMNITVERNIREALKKYRGAERPNEAQPNRGEV